MTRMKALLTNSNHSLVILKMVGGLSPKRAREYQFTIEMDQITVKGLVYSATGFEQLTHIASSRIRTMPQTNKW